MNRTMLSRIEIVRRAPDRTVCTFVRFLAGGEDVHGIAFRLEEAVTRVNGVRLPPFDEIVVDCAEVDADVSVEVTPRGRLYSGLRNLMERIPSCGPSRLTPKASIELPQTIFWPEAEVSEQRPFASLVIPTRDRLELLRTAVATLFENATWSPQELVVVDNGSVEPPTLEYLALISQRPDVVVVRDDGPFNFARLINLAASRARGEILAFLNNDVEAIDPDWLSPLVALAMDSRVGAVGTRLLYADGTVQHAGIALGVGGLAGHPGRGLNGDDPGPGSFLTKTRRASAVTAACMVVRRDRFEEVGGFDEDYVVEFNDVDFCLRLEKAGFATVCAAYPTLLHREGSTRKARRLRAQEIRDRSRFMRQWGARLPSDPWYPAPLSPRDESLSISAT